MTCFPSGLTIAEDDRDAADRVEAEMYASFSFLGSSRLSGHIRQDLTDLPVRFWTIPRFRHYVIVYDPNSHPVRIIRVLHGSLDIPHHLNIIA